MRMFQEPKNFEREEWAYLSIGYYHGKVVLKNEMEELYFLEAEENMAPEGTVIPDSMEVTPIEVLAEEEQETIRELFG